MISEELWLVIDIYAEHLQNRKATVDRDKQRKMNRLLKKNNFLNVEVDCPSLISTRYNLAPVKKV